MNDVSKIVLCSFPGILSGNYILLLQWRGKNTFYIKQKFLSCDMLFVNQSSKLVPILDLGLCFPAAKKVAFEPIKLVSE